MRSLTFPFLLLGTIGLASAESDIGKKKCSSVYPSSSSADTSGSLSVSVYSPAPTETSSRNSDRDSIISSLSGSSGSASSTEPSLTLTTSASVTSSSVAVKTVVNDVGNGNFGSYDANSPGGIANWDSQNCELNLQYGYQGDGSADTGCVQMTAGPSGGLSKAKRTDYTAMIEQQLEEVDATSQYTIRFYYTILSNSLTNTCRMEAYYGEALLTVSDYFDVVTNGVAGNTPWIELVDEVALSSSDGYIRFQLSCTGDGFAVVFIDEVFVSNKVDASSKDNISLLFTSTGSAASMSSTSTSESTMTTATIDSTSTTNSATESSSTASVTVASETSSISSSSLIAASSTTSESISASSSLSSSSTLSSTTSSSMTGSSATTPTMCVASASATSGLTCGSLIYTNKGYYKQVRVADVTRDQCVAACLADSTCQSISYYSTQTCSATCFLQSSSVAAMGYTFQHGLGFPAVWDRGCFTQTACAAPSEGSVCIDKWGSAPASTCKASFTGNAKSCAQPFKTTTVSGLCGSGACAAICKQYPSCKTYSATYGGSVTCNFYSEDISDVADSASSATLFADMSCLECGAGSSVFNWLSPLADPSSMPDMSSCTSGSSSTASIISSTASSTTSVTTVESSTITSLIPTSSSSTTTTTTTGSSTTSCVTCTAVPSASVPSGSTCGIQGDYLYQDAYGVSTGSQNSMMDCAAICNQDSSCKAYGYRANSNIYYGCAFIQSSLSDAGFFTTTSGNYYWSDESCASCGNSCSSSSTLATSSVSVSATTSSFESTTTASMSVTTTSSSSSATTCTSCTAEPSASTVFGVSCAEKGTVSNYTPYSFTTAEYPGQNSLMECAAICAQVPGCKSYGLDVYNVGCKFLDYSLADAGLVSTGASNIYWSDKWCATCGLCASSSSSFGPLSTTLSTSTLSGSSSQTTSTSTSASASASASSSCAVPSAKLVAGVTCGLPGSDSSANTIETVTTAGSLSACASHCLLATDCLSFQYSTQDTSCHVYSTSLANDGLGFSLSSTNYYYDRECFYCS
ncbi:hypothetical protein BKA67DRAFT_541518 [Truncatella angustata]|uniref:Apple domain-containing protein n=1 Tax=Truncatella angustata TaxID=152316 RepID=A0A9P8RL38_9PEZI|nr:uncharacterized protein BKA67DRAFT_541518 [Truncatella angustata]KAH6645285.1 hypothetical protein BKA67DRAFT_541518 [Truncatella angustata]KAH8203334.1 hypothetical protein TruAng_002530 [Truncatella angustata]